MARRQQPFTPRPANLSTEQMRVAIPVLERRLSELEALDPTTATESPERTFREVELKIDDTLISIFGNDTVEYRQFHVGWLNMSPNVIGRPTPRHEIIQGYARGKENAITKLRPSWQSSKKSSTAWAKPSPVERSE
jgi:hypothetical protein